MDESYADTPVTLGEIRADRQESAAAWSSRDVLIQVLRMIDRGECDPDTLVVAWWGRAEGGGNVSKCRISSQDVRHTIALLADLQHWYHSLLPD